MKISETLWDKCLMESVETGSFFKYQKIKSVPGKDCQTINILQKPGQSAKQYLLHISIKIPREKPWLVTQVTPSICPFVKRILIDFLRKI